MIHPAQLAQHTGTVEQALGQGGFAAVHVGQQTDDESFHLYKLLREKLSAILNESLIEGSLPPSALSRSHRSLLTLRATSPVSGEAVSQRAALCGTKNATAVCDGDRVIVSRSTTGI